MKGWFIFGIIIFSIWAYGDYNKQQRKEMLANQEAACQSNPICMNERNDRKARMDSIISSLPVHSSTGIVYFKGDACTDDCSGHITGYQWAEERGISKDEGCTSNSQSFIEGCLKYVSDRVTELEESVGDVNYDDRDSCTPGRYDDC
jgi:hypothetical protein